MNFKFDFMSVDLKEKENKPRAFLCVFSTDVDLFAGLWQRIRAFVDDGPRYWTGKI